MIRLLVLLIAYLGVTEAVYVVLREGVTKCFRADVPQDTLVVGTFKSVPLYDADKLGSSNPITDAQRGSHDEINQHFHSKQWGILVQVTGPGENPERIHTRSYDPSGRFAFTSSQSGDHQMCLSTNTTAWFNPIVFKLYIEIQSGAEARDWADIAKQEHLSNAEVEVRRLLDRATGIRQELSYQKEREMEFRDLSESTNARAAWWSVFQIVIVVCAALFQMRHMRTFFKKKKIF